MSEEQEKILKLSGIREELRAYFPAKDIKYKPINTKKNDKGIVVSGRALVYADTRAYENVLDEFCGDWTSSVAVAFVNGVWVAHSKVTIFGIPRMAVGSDKAAMDAEARAFKRACSRFGLGRYLYDCKLKLWGDITEYDGFDEASKAKFIKHVPTFENPEVEKTTPAPVKKQYKKTNTEINKDVAKAKDDGEKPPAPPADDVDFCGFSEPQYNNAIKVSDKKGYPTLKECMLQMGYDVAAPDYDPKSKSSGGGAHFLDTHIFGSWGKDIPEYDNSNPQEQAPPTDEEVPPVDEYDEEIDLDEDDPFKEEI